MTDHISEEKRSWNMSQIRSKNTKPELKIRNFLFSNKFRYRIHNSEIPGKPDLSNKSKKIAIFVNGCFWHRHGCKKTTKPKTNIKFWKNKFDKTIERDKNNVNILNKLGWKTIIVWECEVDNREILDRKFEGIINLER